MIKQTVLLFIILLLNLGVVSSQDTLECQTKLSNFHEDVKAKRYDKAYEDWLYVRTNCPDLSLAIYADGEKILKQKIENAIDDKKIGFVNALLNLWKDRRKYFESKTPTGEFEAKYCQLQYEHREYLRKTTQELQHCFDDTFKKDKVTFTHPKSLYTYFSLTVDLFDKGNISATNLFTTYDEVSEKIQTEIQNYSEKLNVLIRKIEKGEALTRKEENKKTSYESYLKNYKLIQQNIDVLVNKRANCENLIPLYSKDYQKYQTDSIWLKRAVSRLHHKECEDDDFYEKLVKQYDRVAPSADTKFFIATILFRKGKYEEAYQYLVDGYELENRPYKKSNLAFRIGVFLKNKAKYTTARNFFIDALKLNPSNGKPHLIIANMYANSAKNCGKDNFHKRAVYWLAAKEAKKASRLDPSLKELVSQSVANYLAKAPSMEDVFLKGLGGKTIEIKCWINRSVVVPKP